MSSGTGQTLRELRGREARKTERREDRRRRILEAAQKTFSEKGYGDGDLDEIARRARVGKATLYREFGSKKDLLVAVVTEGIEELRDRMVRAVTGAGAPAQVFGDAVKSALSFIEENRSLMRVLLLEAGELRGEFARRYFERYTAAKGAADAVFKMYPPAKALAKYSPGHLADVLMYLISGRVLVWVLSGGEGSLSDEADLLLHTYVSGVFESTAESRAALSPS